MGGKKREMMDKQLIRETDRIQNRRNLETERERERERGREMQKDIQ